MAKAEELREDMELDFSGAGSDFNSVLTRMMDYPIFRELCQAIMALDTRQVRMACTNLTNMLIKPVGEERRLAVMDMYGYLDRLVQSIKDDDVDGYLAPLLRTLAGELLDIGQPGGSDEQTAASIAEAFREFAVGICEELQDDGSGNETGDGTEGQSVGEGSASGEGGGEGGTTASRTDGVEDSGALTFGNQLATYGGKGVSGFSVASGGVKDATESMFEPTYGENVPYGTMYGIYYSRMLNYLLDEETVDEEVRNALELYFSGI